jgi:GH15 family glucan-1,4-alpha-glucosidase
VATPDVSPRYPPLRDYALIGDGRTAALVSRAGSIDWWCLPNLDSPSVFGALLDADRGGRFTLGPAEAADVHRRYLPGTNVLETTFTTAGGRVRVIDALTLPRAGLAPFRELVRRVEGLAGRVPMRWRLEPRFGYGLARTRVEPRVPYPVASSGGTALGLCAWDAGPVTCDAGGMEGSFEASADTRATLVASAAYGEPLVFPRRDEVERRLEATVAFWRAWATELQYAGPWRDAVVRSALALKLLIFAPSGAIAAAPTTSLPEALGGERNWDYRFSWIRDSSFTLESLLQLGCVSEARAFFWWFMHATQRTRPRVNVFYRLDGDTRAPEVSLPLDGYRGSRPVRVGNGAAGQLQLDTYGELVDAVYQFARREDALRLDTSHHVAQIADFVCAHWREPDAGIWEVRAEPRHHTQSKAMCWVALDRALALARAGQLPTGRVDRWTREAAAIRQFIDAHCWSTRKQSYVGYAGTEDLDASLLLLGIMRYEAPDSPRLHATVAAIRRELGVGSHLRRYTGDDGLAGGEGAFTCCAFWLVEALGITGQRADAERLMEELLALGNDVGLYAEEVEPGTGEFLGNFPQGLVHLALVSAATALQELAA